MDSSFGNYTFTLSPTVNLASVFDDAGTLKMRSEIQDFSMLYKNNEYVLNFYSDGGCARCILDINKLAAYYTNILNVKKFTALAGLQFNRVRSGTLMQTDGQATTLFLASAKTAISGVGLHK